MKRLFQVLVLSALAVSPAFAQEAAPSLRGTFAPEAPKRISVIGKMGRVKLAPRDSLIYTLRWGKGVNATGYRVSVTGAATPVGATSGLPANVAVTDTTITFTAINNTFDSLSLNASVISTRGTRSSAAATKTWFVVRVPGAPGGIIIDSTAIPPLLSSLDVALIPPTLAIGSTGKACAYLRFNTLAAMRTQDAVDCQVDFIARYTGTQRNITPATQTYADRACVTWSSTNPGVATVTSTEFCPLARVGDFYRVASIVR
jgi:hypothetical protein